MSTVNKCTVIVMIIIIINVKSFLGRHFFWDFNEQFSKTNVLYEKDLLCIQPLRCTAKLDKFSAMYLVLTKEMTQI